MYYVLHHRTVTPTAKLVLTVSYGEKMFQNIRVFYISVPYPKVSFKNRLAENRGYTNQPYLHDALHLTDRLIPPTRRARTRPSNPKTKHQLLPKPMSLPSDSRLLRLLTLAPPACLTEPLNGNLIQPIILHAEFLSARPEIAAVADDADVEWVRGVSGTREAVGGFAGCEAVKADELQEKTGVAARCVPVRVCVCVCVCVAMCVCVAVCMCRCAAFAGQRVVRVAGGY